MPTKNERFLIAGLFLLYIISVLVNLGYLELSGEEPRRAIISLEMLQFGNYFKPTQMGWDYYNKPVLFNWILCGIMILSNSSSEFVLRLPSFLFFLLWVFCHYQIGKKFLPKKIALISAAFMLTSAEIYFYGLAKGAEIDIFYSFIVYLQAVSIFYYFQQKAWSKLYFLSYFFCAIGFLTKGFPSLVFQGLTLIAICHFGRSVKVLFKPAHLVGILVLLATTSVYFFFYSQYNSPQRLLINLLNESLIKSGIGERSNQLFDKAIGYPFLLFKLFAPWSLLLFLLRKSIWKEASKNPLILFSFLFIVYNIWVYWLTGQPKARYVYMFVPFGSAILSFIYWKASEKNNIRIEAVLKYLGIAFALVLLVVIMLPFFEPVPAAITVVMSIALFVFLYFYFKTWESKLWLFITGIVLIRLVYAAVLVPVQYEKIANYSRNTKMTAARLQSAPLSFWAPPNQFTFAVNTSVFSKTFESIPAPPVLHAQVPYYYHKYTGHLVLYDSALIKNRYYFSFEENLRNQSVDSLFSFENRKEPGRLVVFQVKP